MAKIEPWNALFPVAFRSGGDTTREAFGKHIQEIDRIYSLLNELNSNKLSADDVNETLSKYDSKLQEHINSTNPHPKWKPSLSFDDITGNLDASRVHGKLTNATIDAGKVNGLKDFVNNLVPDNGDGITGSDIKENGYVKFGNGLIIQWGETAKQYEYVHPSIGTEHKFKTEFPSQCFTVIGQTCQDGITGGTSLGAMHTINEISKTGFMFTHQKFHASDGGGPRGWFIRYIAIGI